VDCNLTLMFCIDRAIAAAEAGTYLISPFVGRIHDWYKVNTEQDYNAKNEPGIESGSQIFSYYKKYGYDTIIMRASFRSLGEIIELAGCDYFTIAPRLLEQLYNSKDPVPQMLRVGDVQELDIKRQTYFGDEALSRFELNEDSFKSRWVLKP
jgi:transaldolase